jgi:hypothetical protein
MSYGHVSTLNLPLFRLVSISFLVSEGIRAGGLQVDGGDGQKSQGAAAISAQISTQASRLMVRVREVFLEPLGVVSRPSRGASPVAMAPHDILRAGSTN